MTFYWEDICVSNAGFPYEFPCARFTPMDFFQETNWYMNFTNGNDAYNNDTVPAPRQDLYRRTWFKNLIQEKLINPRIPRFGVLTSMCAGRDHCFDLLVYRTTTTSPGYSPFSLFADIGNMVRKVVIYRVSTNDQAGLTKLFVCLLFIGHERPLSDLHRSKLHCDNTKTERQCRSHVFGHCSRVASLHGEHR